MGVSQLGRVFSWEVSSGAYSGRRGARCRGSVHGNVLLNVPFIISVLEREFVPSTLSRSWLLGGNILNGFGHPSKGILYNVFSYLIMIEKETKDINFVLHQSIHVV